MSKIKERFTPLQPLLTSIISKCQDKKQLQKIVFDQCLTLAIIQKSPVNCISDFSISIQASFARKEESTCNPFNKMRSEYYCVIDKSWISLNAAVEYLEQGRQFPSPYQPYFHFRANYKQYCDDRATRNYRCECEMVTIYSWTIKIVNIGQTGYYGIILHALDSKRKGERFVQNLANISSIIYEPIIKHKMQAFRLADLRKAYKNAKDDKVPYSLFYYCRELQQTQIKRRPNNIIVVDTAQKILAYNPKKQSKLVCFGSIEGLGCLQFPMKTVEINKQRIKALHTENIEVLFNNLSKKQNKGKTSSEPQLWSSQSESAGEDNSEEDKRQKMIVQEEQKRSNDEDSEESNQDPLRNLYIKKFANLKLS